MPNATDFSADLNISLLADTCRVPGPPGHEQRVRKFILEQVGQYADSYYEDHFGNLVLVKKGASETPFMVAAHMDEIGFMVTHVDENGFLKLTPLGGFDPKTLTSQRVIVHGKQDLPGVLGSKPIHLMDPEERNKAPKLQDFFVDLGMPAEEVNQYIQAGDVVTRDRELLAMGHCFNGKSLDNRVSVYILMEALRLLKDQALPYTLYAVFSAQEEVGLRGVQAATLKIQPKIALAIDTTIAFDVAGARKEEYITSLGKGAAIKLMDSSAIAHPKVVAFLKETAQSHDIPWQTEILTGGGTDTAGMQKFTAGGALAGAISIPTRHIHQTIETVHKEDIKAALRLLCLALVHANQIQTPQP